MEDLISRQAVIDGIDNYIEKVQSTGAKDDFISFEELVVKGLPSIQPNTDVLDKIRAIVDDWKADTWKDNLSYECMVKIAEIVGEKE